MAAREEVVSAPAMTASFYARRGKRILDLIAGSGFLVILSPVFALISLLIRMSSPGPILFVQERLGQGGSTFRALKFRTLLDRPRVPDTEYFRGDQNEITAIGRLLRRTKLDELPQLLNVVKGDMSLVGPRPQLPVQVKEFNDDARLRLLVRPGLTGLAQTHGNTSLTWPERWHYDAQYVRNLSLKQDLVILARTVAVLLFGENRYLKRPVLTGGQNHQATE